MLNVMKSIVKVAEKHISENKTGLHEADLKARIDIFIEGAFLIYSDVAFIRLTDTPKGIEDMDKEESHYYYDFIYDSNEDKFTTRLNKGVLDNWIDETVLERFTEKSSFEYFIDSMCKLILRNDDEPVFISIIDSFTNEVIDRYFLSSINI